MSERPFMQLYVSEFLGDTLHLSTEQIGAYMLLLMAMWNAGGSLPNDDAKLARVVRMSLKKWRPMSDDIMTFFDVAGDEITNKRLTKELQKVEGKSKLRAAAGARGGAAKSLKNKDTGIANAVANGVAKPWHLPDTIEEKEETIVSSKKTAKKACQIPSDFKPDISLAVSRGLPRQQAEIEAEKFRNYWIATGKPMKDWPATWRNWIINAMERRGMAPQAADPPVENDSRWNTRLTWARQRGLWSSAEWGGPPGSERCRVPKHLLTADDFKIRWKEYQGEAA